MLIYRKDSVEGGNSDNIIKGSETVVIPPNSSASVNAETVDLVNFYKAGKAIGSSGGGCSSGSCGGGSVTYSKSERSRDYLIGCVARVTVDGHVVGVSAASPGIQEKHEAELDSAN